MKLSLFKKKSAVKENVNPILKTVIYEKISDNNIGTKQILFNLEVQIYKDVKIFITDKPSEIEDCIHFLAGRKSLSTIITEYNNCNIKSNFFNSLFLHLTEDFRNNKQIIFKKGEESNLIKHINSITLQNDKPHTKKLVKQKSEDTAPGYIRDL